MKKKILILGVTGMLGYNSYKILKNKNYDVFGTCRNMYNLDDPNIIFFEHSIDNIIDNINKIKPNIIINCIAQLRENSYQDKNNMVYSNCIIPINICKYCKDNNIYFIHFSTDAVFKSSNEYHSINSNYSPESFYGMTKSLSESISNDSLVLRICPIGYDKFKRKSLFNFIYDNKDSNIRGYKNVYFNGTTTIVIIDEIIKIIDSKENYKYGIHHITGPKISKFDLLEIINEEFNLNKKIISVNEPSISRLLKDDILDSSKLNWRKMIEDLKLITNSN